MLLKMPKSHFCSRYEHFWSIEVLPTADGLGEVPQTKRLVIGAATKVVQPSTVRVSVSGKEREREREEDRRKEEEMWKGEGGRGECRRGEERREDEVEQDGMNVIRNAKWE